MKQMVGNKSLPRVSSVGLTELVKSFTPWTKNITEMLLNYDCGLKLAAVIPEGLKITSLGVNPAKPSLRHMLLAQVGSLVRSRHTEGLSEIHWLATHLEYLAGCLISPWLI